MVEMWQEAYAIVNFTCKSTQDISLNLSQFLDRRPPFECLQPARQALLEFSAARTDVQQVLIKHQHKINFEGLHFSTPAKVVSSDVIGWELYREHGDLRLAATKKDHACYFEVDLEKLADNNCYYVRGNNCLESILPRKSSVAVGPCRSSDLDVNLLNALIAAKYPQP